MANCIVALILFALTAVSLRPLAVLADAATGNAAGDPADQATSGKNEEKQKASANYYKDDQFLPGEEVVTPTGQKLKVWSTKGPVDVSRAPDPFEDREKSLLNNTNIEVDARDRRKDDSFDHSPPEEGSERR